MPLHALLFAAGLWAWLVGADPGTDDGRRGNRHYADGAFQEAGRAYLEGLNALVATLDPEADATHDADAVGVRLAFNLGNVSYQMEEYEAAATSFSIALAKARDPQVEAAAHYGAGLAAARQEQYDAALDHFAQALRLQPDFPAAAYNWEWVRRQMPDAPPPEEDAQPEPPEPTPFAEALKAQADELVAARRYRDAQQLMLDGLEQDSTVGAYADFTERLGAVADIDEL